MLDFKVELDKILKEDPLGILKIKVSQPVTADKRLKESFEEINKFIDEHGKEPEQSNDINERKLFSRLNALKKNFEKANSLKEYDKHNLLKEIKEIQTVDDILDNDAFYDFTSRKKMKNMIIKVQDDVGLGMLEKI